MKSFAKAWPFFVAAALAGSTPLLRFLDRSLDLLAATLAGSTPLPSFAGPSLDLVVLAAMAAALVGAPLAMICGPLVLGAVRSWDWPAAIGFYVVFHVTYYLAYLLAPSTVQLIGPAELSSAAAIATLSLGIGASARGISQGHRLLSRGPLRDAWPYLAGIGAVAGFSWIWALLEQACDVRAPGFLCNALISPVRFSWLDGLLLLITPLLMAFLSMMLLGLRRGGDLLTVALCLIAAVAVPSAVYYPPAIGWTFLMGLGYAIPGAGGFAIGVILRGSLHTRYTTRASR